MRLCGGLVFVFHIIAQNFKGCNIYIYIYIGEVLKKIAICCKKMQGPKKKKYIFGSCKLVFCGIIRP